MKENKVKCTKCDGKGFNTVVTYIKFMPVHHKWKCLACSGTGVVKEEGKCL